MPLGRIVKAKGTKGEIQIYPYGKKPENWMGYPLVLLYPDTPKRIILTDLSVIGPSKVRARLQGVDDMESAQALVGLEIGVKRRDLPPTEDDEYYWHDLIGLRVETVSGEGLGTLSAIMETGAHDVYVVKGPRGEILLPAIDEVISGIDLEARTMTVDPLPGLIEANDI